MIFYSHLRELLPDRLKRIIIAWRLTVQAKRLLMWVSKHQKLREWGNVAKPKFPWPSASGVSWRSFIHHISIQLWFIWSETLAGYVAHVTFNLTPNSIPLSTFLLCKLRPPWLTKKAEQELTWIGSSIFTAALLPSILFSTLYTFPYVPLPMVSIISQVSVGSGKLSKTMDFPGCGNIFRRDLLRETNTRVTVRNRGKWSLREKNADCRWRRTFLLQPCWLLHLREAEQLVWSSKCRHAGLFGNETRSTLSVWAEGALKREVWEVGFKTPTERWMTHHHLLPLYKNETKTCHFEQSRCNNDRKAESLSRKSTCTCSSWPFTLFLSDQQTT